MIHLSYHPAFDAFHAIFRFLRIKERLSLSKLEVDKLRILDYYVLFPWTASFIKLSQSDLEVRRVARKLEHKKDYATLPRGETLLERMKVSQLAALQTMAQDGVIDTESLRKDEVRFLPYLLTDSLAKRIKERNDQDPDTLWIINKLSEYPLLGSEGLKGRTSLLEYRYDKV